MKNPKENRIILIRYKDYPKKKDQIQITTLRDARKLRDHYVKARAMGAVRVIIARIESDEET